MEIGNRFTCQSYQVKLPTAAICVSDPVSWLSSPSPSPATPCLASPPGGIYLLPTLDLTWPALCLSARATWTTKARQSWFGPVAASALWVIGAVVHQMNSSTGELARRGTQSRGWGLMLMKSRWACCDLTYMSLSATSRWAKRHH